MRTGALPAKRVGSGVALATREECRRAATGSAPSLKPEMDLAGSTGGTFSAGALPGTVEDPPRGDILAKVHSFDAAVTTLVEDVLACLPEGIAVEEAVRAGCARLVDEHLQAYVQERDAQEFVSRTRRHAAAEKAQQCRARKQAEAEQLGSESRAALQAVAVSEAKLAKLQAEIGRAEAKERGYRTQIATLETRVLALEAQGLSRDAIRVESHYPANQEIQRHQRPLQQAPDLKASADPQSPRFQAKPCGPDGVSADEQVRILSRAGSTPKLIEAECDRRLHAVPSAGSIRGSGAGSSGPSTPVGNSSCGSMGSTRPTFADTSRAPAGALARPSPHGDAELWSARQGCSATGGQGSSGLARPQGTSSWQPQRMSLQRTPPQCRFGRSSAQALTPRAMRPPQPLQGPGTRPAPLSPRLGHRMACRTPPAPARTINTQGQRLPGYRALATH